MLAAAPPLGDLHVAVLRRGGCDQLVEQMGRGGRDRRDGALERLGVDRRRLGGAADLPHVLESRVADLGLGRGR